MAAATLLPGSLRAQQDPHELVQQISRQVFQVARQDAAILGGDRQRILQLVTRVILPHVDMERMTRLAVGRYWRDAAPWQRDKLVAEFRDLLIHVYSGALAQVGDKELVFRPMRADTPAGEAEVRSLVLQKGGEPIEINYRLVRVVDGWKIFDLSVFGVWLVQSYREGFQHELARGGIDGLIGVLERKNRHLARTASATETLD